MGVVKVVELELKIVVDAHNAQINLEQRPLSLLVGNILIYEIEQSLVWVRVHESKCIAC